LKFPREAATGQQALFSLSTLSSPVLIRSFQVVPCSRKGPHSWIECQYAHPQEKAARRCPVQHTYLPIACPDMKTDAQCPRGDNCHFAHSVFEYWLHPARYRTSLCSFGIECKRSICFFAHQPGELRTSNTIAQLQALERDLEASDPAFAAPTSNNAKWSGGLSQQLGQPSSPEGKPQRQMGGQPRTPRQQQQQQTLGADPFQQSQMRHLVSAQQANVGLSQQALVQAAMLESSMQPATPRSLGLARSPSLTAPLASPYQQQQQEHLSLTMKLLNDMSSSPQQAQGKAQQQMGSPRLQATNSMPIKSAHLNHLHQHVSTPGSVGGSSEVQQALSLVSQLQELTMRSQNSGDLHSVLSAVLPQLMMQVGAAQAAEAVAKKDGNGPLSSYGSLPMPVAQAVPADQRFFMGSLDQGCCFSPSSLQGLDAAHPSLNQQTHRLASCSFLQSGSPSPVDVLSIGSGRKTACGSSSYSGSSRSLSPDPSDDGQNRNPQRRSSGDPPAAATVLKGDTHTAAFGLYDTAIGPFSMIPQGLQGFADGAFRHDNDLASGMTNMMGSLSLLVTTPSSMHISLNWPRLQP